MRRAVLADAVVGSDLRQTDKDDLAATTRESGLDIVTRNIARGDRTVSFDHHGLCVAVAGVVDSPTGAVIWLLGTPGFDEMMRAGGVRLSKRWMAVLAGPRKTVFNVVPIESGATLRWLEWMGFLRGKTFENFHGLGHVCVEMILER